MPSLWLNFVRDISKNCETLSLQWPSSMMSRSSQSFLFNNPLFSQKHDERMKKIGGIVPEILGVFTFSHATHFHLENRRLICAAVPSPVASHILKSNIKCKYVSRKVACHFLCVDNINVYPIYHRLLDVQSKRAWPWPWPLVWAKSNVNKPVER